jgi:hypothetical protein
MFWLTAQHRYFRARVLCKTKQKEMQLPADLDKKKASFFLCTPLKRFKTVQ